MREICTAHCTKCGKEWKVRGGIGMNTEDTTHPCPNCNTHKFIEFKNFRLELQAGDEEV